MSKCVRIAATIWKFQIVGLLTKNGNFFLMRAGRSFAVKGIAQRHQRINLRDDAVLFGERGTGVFYGMQTKALSQRRGLSETEEVSRNLLK
jgi:hypothetical protein